MQILSCFHRNLTQWIDALILLYSNSMSETYVQARVVSMVISGDLISSLVFPLVV